MSADLQDSTPSPEPLFPQRLYHQVPGWVKDGGFFHLRFRATHEQHPALTDPALAPHLLESVAYYNERQAWHSPLFLLMPDHAHALISFRSKRK